MSNQLQRLARVQDPQRIMNSLKKVFVTKNYLQVFKDICSRYDIIQRRDMLIRLAIEIDIGITEKDFSKLENDFKQQHVLLNKKEWLKKSNHKSISLEVALACIKLANQKLHEKSKFHE